MMIPTSEEKKEKMEIIRGINFIGGEIASNKDIGRAKQFFSGLGRCLAGLRVGDYIEISEYGSLDHWSNGLLYIEMETGAYPQSESWKKFKTRFAATFTDFVFEYFPA